MKKVIWFLLLSLFLLSCQKSKEYEKTELLLGTYVRIKVYKTHKKKAKKAVDKAFNEIARIDSLSSTFNRNSEVFKLNREGEGFVSPDLKRMIQKAFYVSKITDGAFDITVYFLEDLWGFYSGNYRVPPLLEIEETLKRTNYKNIILKRDSLYLLNGVEIDLAGIAKGYAVDRAVEILKREGISTGLVDAGGDIRVFGNKKGGFKIGLKHPRKDGIFRVFTIKDKAIATSGDYKKFFVRDNQRYCHIINPHSGYPAKRCVSATIVCEDAITADALATALFVLGLKKGMALAKSLKKRVFFIYEEDGKLKTMGTLE